MIDIKTYENVPCDESGMPIGPLMDEINKSGNDYFNAVDAIAVEGATDRVKFLVDEWRFSRGPYGGGIYKPEDRSNYDIEVREFEGHKSDWLTLKPGMKRQEFKDTLYAHERYEDYTWEEKLDAYYRTMTIISYGCG
jgi:hypothetical protein